MSDPFLLIDGAFAQKDAAFVTSSNPAECDCCEFCLCNSSIAEDLGLDVHLQLTAEIWQRNHGENWQKLCDLDWRARDRHRGSSDSTSCGWGEPLNDHNHGQCDPGDAWPSCSWAGWDEIVQFSTIECAWRACIESWCFSGGMCGGQSVELASYRPGPSPFGSYPDAAGTAICTIGFGCSEQDPCTCEVEARNIMATEML